MVVVLPKTGLFPTLGPVTAQLSITRIACGGNVEELLLTSSGTGIVRMLTCNFSLQTMHSTSIGGS